MTLTGFTLFWNPGKKSWQMSVSTDAEDGWSVSHVADEVAQRVLRLIESDNAIHGCGPWRVREFTIEEAVRRMTEKLRGLA